MLENRLRRRIEEIYEFNTELRIEDAAQELDEDLFSEDAWRLFGLTRKQLATAGSAGGAAVGLMVDVGTGGTTLGFGTFFGAVGGGAAAWFGSDQLAKVNAGPLNRSLGTKELRYGPVTNLNFPYVVLNRALYHHRLITSKTHARRDEQTEAMPNDLNRLSNGNRKELARKFVKLAKAPEDVDVRSRLTEIIAELLRAP